jgi:type I restriction enzyme M protein
MYQHFMDYWDETMKDDVYILAEDGWVAKTKRILEKNKSGKQVDKGWTCDLIPKQLVIDNYLAKEQQALNDLVAQLETNQAEITAYNEEHAGDEGLLNDATNDKGSITKTTLTKYLKHIKGDKTEKEAYDLGNKMATAFAKETTLKNKMKTAEQALDGLTLKQFGLLTEKEVRTLVVDDKWLTTISAAMQGEIDSISQRLTGRIKELAERYENTLGELDKSNTELEQKVAGHLEKMGLVWS